VEYGWGVEEFLSHTCMKAGLRSDEWRHGKVRFKRFSGQVFGEDAPRGEVREMPLS
jgi:AMMECR1 domain-containing protein